MLTISCIIPTETIPMDMDDPTGIQSTVPKYKSELVGFSFISDNNDGTWLCALSFQNQADKDSFLALHTDVTEVI